jgi:hypothetical protein
MLPRTNVLTSRKDRYHPAGHNRGRTGARAFQKKGRPLGRPVRVALDQPFSALAARRERLPDFGSSAPLLLAAAPPLVLLELAPAPMPPLVLPPAPVLELAPPLRLLPPMPPPAPGEVVPGFAAPCSPAALPAPARPALSVSAGEPCAAYAPATAADIQPATNTIMSFFIRTSRK